MVVIAVRDIWMSGERLPGMKPYLCLTDKRLYLHTYARRNQVPRYQVIDRSSASRRSLR